MLHVNEIKKDHEEIRGHLDQLEEIMEVDEIHYPNLIHVFKNLSSKWDSHEAKEENFFKKMKTNKDDFPFEKMLFQHKDLRGHKKVIEDAINSGDELEMKISLETDGQMLISKLRNHLDKEEWHLDKLFR